MDKKYLNMIVNAIEELAGPVEEINYKDTLEFYFRDYLKINLYRSILCMDKCDELASLVKLNIPTVITVESQEEVDVINSLTSLYAKIIEDVYEASGYYVAVALAKEMSFSL